MRQLLIAAAMTIAAPAFASEPGTVNVTHSGVEKAKPGTVTETHSGPEKSKAGTVNETHSGTPAPRAKDGKEEGEDDKDDAAEEANEGVTGALDLPNQVAAVRADGLAEADITAVLASAKANKLSAADAAELLAAEDAGLKDKGPVENFGAWLDKELKDGVRGKDLAKAIKAAHDKSGKKPAAAPTDKTKTK